MDLNILKEMIEEFDLNVDYSPNCYYTEAIEVKARDGYFPYTNGGWVRSCYVDVYYMISSGYIPPAVRNQVESLNDDAWNSALECMKEKYPDFDYDVECTKGGELIDEFDEHQRTYLEDVGYWFYVKIQYYAPENDRCGGNAHGIYAEYWWTYGDYNNNVHGLKNIELAFEDFDDVKEELRTFLKGVECE